MAIFVLFAWCAELAEKMGWIQTAPVDCKGRAYLRANEGCQWLRHELVGARIHAVEETRIHYANGDGEQELECADGALSRHAEREAALYHGHFSQPEANRVYPLGPGGWARFSLQDGRLAVELVAADDEGGPRAEHRMAFSFQVVTGP